MPIQITVDTTNFCNNVIENKRTNSPLAVSNSSQSALRASTFHEDTNISNHNEIDVASVEGRRRQHDASKIRKNFFPYRLMGILSSPLFKDCATWDHEGESFVITDMETFSSKSNLSSSTLKKESFARKLNRWGFRMNRTKGCGYYSHPLFCRDKPWLCETMRCQKTVKTQSDSRHNATRKTVETSNKRNIIDCGYDKIDSHNSSENLKRRRMDNKENLEKKEECEFDVSRQNSVMSRLKCVVDVLSEDYMCNRLEKYLLQRQLQNREFVRILLNAGHEVSPTDRKILECEKATANVHDTVVKNAILALVS